MSTSTAAYINRVPIRLAVVAAVLTPAVGILAGVAIAGENDDPAPDDGQVVEVVEEGGEVESNPETPIWIQVREQRRICQLVAQMPSYWPATQVMRQEAERPLGDAAQRARSRHDAELLPSYWPAAQVMLAAAEQGPGCSP